MKSLKFLLPCVFAFSCALIPSLQHTTSPSNKSIPVLDTAVYVSCVVEISSTQEYFYMNFDMNQTDLLYYVPDEPDMDCFTTNVLNSIKSQSEDRLIFQESQLLIYANGVSLLEYSHDSTLQDVCQYLSVSGINLIT
jgi:hypothetical protein